MKTINILRAAKKRIEIYGHKKQWFGDQIVPSRSIRGPNRLG